jgi:cellulose synthase/poly-beta-1,6-N-acetylglucosamine synthase-like glycosyltransferase
VNDRSTPLASVVIPVLNAAPMLERLLRHLDRQTLRDRMKVIVVDNGSSDDSFEVAKRHGDVAVKESRQGIPYAKQRGLEEVDTPFVLSIDADCVPRSTGWAEVLVGGLTAAGCEVLGISGPVVPMPSHDRWSQREDLTPASGIDESGRISYVVGCNHGHRTSVLQSLGGYPVSRFAAEDAALGIRARARGYSFTWAPEATVLHENPEGWRGYARKMRQVGRYHADLVERPRSMVRFTAFHSARMIKCMGRDICHGDLFEATAESLKISSQVMGAWDIWKADRLLALSPPSPFREHS